MTLVPQQVLEEFELAGGQVEDTPPSLDRARRSIELQVGHLQPQRVCGTTAAQERADAREQFGKGERFDQIIVGAKIESEYSVVDPVASGQNQNRRLQA